MNYELIKVEESFDGEVSEITLGPPPANIVSAKMMEEISVQLKEDENNKNIPVFSQCRYEKSRCQIHLKIHLWGYVFYSRTSPLKTSRTCQVRNAMLG